MLSLPTNFYASSSCSSLLKLLRDLSVSLPACFVSLRTSFSLPLSLSMSRSAYPLVCSSLSPVSLSGAVEVLCRCPFPCAHAMLLVLFFLRSSRLPQTHFCCAFVSFQCLSLLLPRHFDPVLPSPHCRYTVCTCRSVVACGSSQEKHTHVACVHVLCCTKASQYACTACSIASCAFVLCL